MLKLFLFFFVIFFFTGSNITILGYEIRLKGVKTEKTVDEQ